MKNIKKDILLILKGLKEIRSIRKMLVELVVIQAAFNSVTPFVNIYMSALIINKIAAKAGLETLLRYTVITILANLFVALLKSMLSCIIQYRQSEFIQRYEMKLSMKIMSMDYIAVENPETHRLRTKIKEMHNMGGGGIWALFTGFRNMIQALFTVVFSVSLAFSLFLPGKASSSTGMLKFAAMPYFSVILAVAIVANVFVDMYTNSSITRLEHRYLDDAITLNRLFAYFANNFITWYPAGKDIRIYNLRPLIAEEFHSFLDYVIHSIKKQSKTRLRFSNLNTVSANIISILVYLFVGLKALAGLFGVGSVVRYVGSIQQFTGAFTRFMTEFAMLRVNNKAIRIYFDYMEMPSQMYHGTLPVEKRAFCDNGDNEYEIEFRNVSFKYPGSETYALRNVSIRFRVGQKLAVVGMNGSGKTTFIKLLCRLYDPTEGEILLNGVDIKKYDINEYMSLFSVVFQDFRLFAFTLGQNVAASVDYDAAWTETCLGDAGFRERYKNMPKGLETYLYKHFEKDGVEISGGEAQKIALARALYKNAPFIILDEPTAALDPVAEYEVYTKFNEIVGNKTAVYISHRLASCRFCDDIVVFDQGRIVQRGSHDELVADENGRYHELWHAQAQYYNDKACSNGINAKA